MNNKDLLKAIQNADRSYFEKAEQRMHHREEHTVKTIIMRRVMTGTAAAAVLAVSVTGGIHLANRSSGLTEPSASTPATAPIEVQSSVIAAAVTDTTVTAAQTADPGPVNCFGGHGRFRFSPHSGLMCDDDFWYVNTLDCAPKSNAGFLPLERISSSSKVVNELGMYLIDLQSPILYHVMTHKPDKAVYVVSEDGTETKLAFDNLAACFRGSTDYPNPGACPLTITHLKDGKYYVYGTLFDADDPDNTQKSRPFWEIYDTETQTGNGEIRCPGERVFYDGDCGVYAIYDSWNDGNWEPGQELVRRYLHFRADGTAETVFELVSKNTESLNTYGNFADFTLNSWFVYNNCIYYTDFESADYCKYDMSTRETTTLRESEPYNEKYYFVNGTVYFVSNQENKLFYGEPDLQNLNAWDIQLLDTDPKTALRHVDAVIDNTVVITKEIGDNSDAEHTNYMVLYHPDTGAAQYLYDPMFFTPSETASETTAAAAVTDTVTTETAATTTVQTTTRRDGTNFLGGLGNLIHLPLSGAMCDDDHWYENMINGVPKSDAKYLPREKTAYGETKYNGRLIFMDSYDSTIYHLHESEDFAYLTTINPDGTETKVFQNITAPISDSFKPGINYKLFSVSIGHLENGFYFIDGLLENCKDETDTIQFMEIYDTAADTAHGYVVPEDFDTYTSTQNHKCSWQVYPDGATGVYHIEDGKFKHFTADGKNEIVLDQAICNETWFAYNDCIYYVAYGTQDYCKYDLKTKETTVLIQNTGWNPPETGTCNLCLADGTVYAIKNGGTLVYGDPDMTEPHEWKIEYPESMEVYRDFCFVKGVCDNTVFLENVDFQFAPESANPPDDELYTVKRHDYRILYHTDTGKVQYIYEPGYYTPPAE